MCAFLGKTSKYSFGQLLDTMIENSEYSKREFYEKLGIKKAYFYDIINSRTNPPPSEKQFAIIKILKPDEKTCNEFFDLAAKERNEFPADIKKYLDSNKLKELRNSNEFIEFTKSYR